MYDGYDDYPEVSSWYAGRVPEPERMVHLCPECRDLMGQVISYARRLPEPRPEPDWSRALRWLDSVCGGREAVLGFDTAPLDGDGLELPAGLPATHRQRLESCITLLDATARRFFGDEARTAFVRALLRVYEREPGTVTSARSAAQLALGVLWAVGRANGLLHPRGVVKEKDLKPYLNVTQSASTLGTQVLDALLGAYPWLSSDRPWRYGGGRSRDLEPLGHVDLLVASARRQLLEVRERALADQQREGAARLTPAGPVVAPVTGVF
jgi:hypothetical protein